MPGARTIAGKGVCAHPSSASLLVIMLKSCLLILRSIHTPEHPGQSRCHMDHHNEPV
jgi:hypothetical protein